MIYSIETIPFVLFSKIVDTGDLTLLSDEKLSEKELLDLWDKMREEYSEHEDTLRNKKIKELKKRIQKENNKYQLVLMALEVLKRKDDADMLRIVEGNGYSLKNGIEHTYKQVENLKNRIVSLQKELSGYTNVNESDKKSSIYESIINISVGLEIPIKCNEVTAIEFIYYKKALMEKIKSLNKQNK